MSRASRGFRFGMLLFLLVGLFGPLTQLPLMAEDTGTPEPAVPVIEIDSQPANGIEDVSDGSVVTNDVSIDDPDAGEPDPVDNTEAAPGPEAVESADLVPVTPAKLINTECGYSSSIQLPTGPAEVEYTLVDNSDGTYVVEARIIDPTAFTWGDLTEPWYLEGDIAKHSLTLAPCIHQPAATAEAESDSPDSEVNDTDEDGSIPVGTPRTGVLRSQSMNNPQLDTHRLSIAIDADPSGAIDPGSQINYKVEISRTGADTGLLIGFKLALPPDVQYLSNDNAYVGYDCDYLDSEHSFECQSTRSWSGSNSVRTFYVSVLVMDPFPLANCSTSLSASVEGWAVDATNSENVWSLNTTDSTSNLVECDPILSISKSPSNIDVEAENQIEYDIVLSVSGADTTGVTITESLPPTLAGYVWAASDCTVAFPSITCGNLEVGVDAATTITITGTPDPAVAPATCGTYTTSATYTHAGVTSDAVIGNINIECDVAYSWTNSAIDGAALPGEEAGFTLRFSNTGNSAFALQLNNALPQLPDGMAWSVSVTAPNQVGVHCNGAEQASFQTASSIACGISNLRPGGEVAIRAVFMVPLNIAPENQLCGNLSNSGTAEFVTPQRLSGSGSDLETIQGEQQNNVPTNADEIFVQCPEVKVTLTDGLPNDAIVQPGDPITYTITVQNSGNIPIDDYVFYTDLDLKTEFVEVVIMPEGADCDPSEGVYLDCWNSDIAHGATETFVYTAAVRNVLSAAQCEESITSTVYAFASQISAADQPIQTAVSTSLECTTGLHFEMTAVNQTIIPGEPIQYSIDLENTGSLKLNNIEIDAEFSTLPDDGIWRATLNGAPLSLPYTLDNLSPDMSVSILIESSEVPADLTVDSAWCDTWSASAMATGTFSNDDALSETNDASARVNCTGLSIEKQAPDEIVNVGERATFTITVTNHGNTELFDVVVGDDIDASSLLLHDWRTDSDACVIEDDLITCSYDQLSEKETLTINISAEAPAIPTLNQCMPVESSAWTTYQTAEAPQVAPTFVGLTPVETRVESNTVTTRIDCQPSVEINSVSELIPGVDDRMDVGDTVIYTVTVTNTGNMAIYDLSVASANNGDLDWSEQGNSVPELAPGESAIFTVVYMVSQADIDAGEVSHKLIANGALEPGAASGNTTIHAFGMASMQVPALETVTAEGIIVTQLEHEASVTLETSVDQVDERNVGDEVTFTFIVTNTGNVTLTNLVVTSPLDGLVWASTPEIPSLVPGESVTLNAMYMITQAEAGQIVGTAKLTAIDPVTNVVSTHESITLQITESAMPNATPTGAPATATPATPPAAPATATPTVELDSGAIKRLPSTGSGPGSTLLPVLWAAAIFVVLALGVCFAGERRHE